MNTIFFYRWLWGIYFVSISLKFSVNRLLSEYRTRKAFKCSVYKNIFQVIYFYLNISNILLINSYFIDKNTDFSMSVLIFQKQFFLITSCTGQVNSHEKTVSNAKSHTLFSLWHHFIRYIMMGQNSVNWCSLIQWENTPIEIPILFGHYTLLNIKPAYTMYFVLRNQTYYGKDE